MIHIKISAPSGNFAKLLDRQIPDDANSLSQYKFYINEDIDFCDWWIILHGSAITEKISVMCDPSHIVYMSMEPDESVLNISNKFLAQFSRVYICDENVKHKDAHYMNVSTWWVGMNVEMKNNRHVFSNYKKMSYSDFKNLEIPNKINRISCIISNKNLLPGHITRLNFIKKLMNEPVGKFIDLYGGNFEPISDKLDAIYPYRFHLAIENCSKKDYWSEKISDCYLGYSFPLYYGCTNIFQYFQKNSLFILDFDSPSNTSKALINLLNSETLDFNALLVSREKILNEFNIFNIITSICNKNSDKKIKCTLVPNFYFNNYYKLLKYLIKKLLLN